MRPAGPPRRLLVGLRFLLPALAAGLLQTASFAPTEAWPLQILALA